MFRAGPPSPYLIPLCLAAACGGDVTTGTIEVAISGERAVVEGLKFNPTPGADERVFVDGWSLTFDRFITAVGAVRLNQPGQDLTQQQKVGALVAEQAGPFAVDLTKKELIPLFVFDKDRDGKGLDTKTRYAFSFDLIPARAGATNVNLDAAGDAAWQKMIAARASTWIEGTATRSPDATPPFDGYPTTVKFQLAWGQSVSYLNCSNPDNGGDEQKNRGVQPRLDGPRKAAISIHTDHPFWDKLNVEDPPLHFDPLAAWAQKPMGQGDFVVTMDDLGAVNITGIKGRDGKNVPDRGTLPGYVRQTGALTYDPNGTPGIGNLKQFMAYSAQALAHLNGEGLCYVERK